MPSQFDNLFAAAGLPHLLEQFGVACAYLPKPRANQSPRDIRAICRYEEPAAEEEDTGDRQKELLWVSCRRDCSAGIDAPALGDALLRHGVDAADSPWSFQGEVRNESPGSWELLFARNRPRRYGPN